MILRITDQSEILDKHFGTWLISHIRTKLIVNIHNYNFVNWDNYLSTSVEINRLYKRPYKTSEYIVLASKCIVCRGKPGEIFIEINPNIFCPGIDRLKLNTLLKTINYGTLNIKGCPIISDTFNFFEKNIHRYASMYYNMYI